MELAIETVLVDTDVVKPFIVIRPVLDHTFVEAKVNDPDPAKDISKLPVPANVSELDADASIPQAAVVASVVPVNVTVPVPEDASNVAVSVGAGGRIPTPEPPDVLAQLPVLVALQVPVPPTQ